MIHLSPEERANNRLNPETLDLAVQAIRVNGYVTFASVLSPEFVQELYDDYMAMFEEYLQNAQPVFASARNHYRMFLPFRYPYSDEKVITNGIALPVLQAILGENLLCHYFASNTCVKDSEYQPIHSDISPLYPEGGYAPPTYHIVLNIPLVDTTEENGPIEIWPGGTHLNTIPRDEMAKLAPYMTSTHATMPAGSIMLRDGRMWHRGTINRSDNPRPNIAICYTRPWVDRGSKPIGIPQENYDGLSDVAKSIFKYENIGGPLDKP